MGNRNTKTRSYEWDVEEVDAYGDVVEHYFQPSFADCLRVQQVLQTRGITAEIVLVLDYGCGTRQEGRCWAYVDALGNLPEEFGEPTSTGRYAPNGIKVPKDFHREVAAVRKENV